MYSSLNEEAVRVRLEDLARAAEPRRARTTGSGSIASALKRFGRKSPARVAAECPC